MKVVNIELIFFSYADIYAKTAMARTKGINLTLGRPHMFWDSQTRLLTLFALKIQYCCRALGCTLLTQHSRDRGGWTCKSDLYRTF